MTAAATLLRFGAPREMLGLWGGAAGSDRALLFCNPFGQEAIRSKPLYRSLADGAGRAGVHTLRFDYHGTGDSPGEGAAQTLAAWCDDALAAAAALQRCSAARRLQLFGLGLGGSIAALCAQRLATPPERLLLWEPVLDGARYIEALCAAHRHELSFAFGAEWAALGQEEPAVPGAVLGFPIGPALAEELAQLRRLPLAELAARGCRVDCALRADQPAPAAAAPRLHWQSSRQPVNWMSNRAMSAAIVPQDVQALLARGWTAA